MQGHGWEYVVVQISFSSVVDCWVGRCISRVRNMRTVYNVNVKE